VNTQPLKTPANRFGTAVLLCCAALVLPGGCSKPGPTQHLDDYLTRLARTLDVEQVTIPTAAAPRMPKTADLRLLLPSANLDALDFLSLSGCAVQITIGKRNSSLGKFASDSQRLLLELEYLQLAPQCIEYMRKSGNSQLADTLEQAHVLKQAQLPGLIFNATLANTEFRAFWKKPADLADYPLQTSSVVLSALAVIALDVERWLAGDYRADNREFEIQLSEVAKGDGGALLLALATQESRLEAANHLLRESLANGPLCSAQYRRAAADTLPKIIQKTFITGMQPWSAALGRRYHELIPALVRLEDLLANALPPSYSHWKLERAAAFSRLISAPMHHVHLLQETLAPCMEK
jgi:hypothetical protein